MNAAERRAQCLAIGGDPSACDELIASESVDGVWCDGEVVIDANGKRCVSRDMLDRVARARASSPLAAPAPPVAAFSVSLTPLGYAVIAVVVYGLWRVLR